MTIGNINTFDADLLACMDAGVAVHRSAIGVPRKIYSSEKTYALDLDTVLDRFGNSVISIRQCAGVMIRNPIFCRPGGTIIWQKPFLKVTSADGFCSASREFTNATCEHYNSGGGGVMHKTMCAHDEIGQGTIVVGAEGGYAHWLAVSIGGEEGALPTKAGSVYVVTFTVGAREVLRTGRFLFY